jgi:hypothetical protein
MHSLLKEMCKQIVTRYAYVSSDRNNDFLWHHVVSSASVTLTGTTESSLTAYIVSGSVVVKNTSGTVTYSETVDYTVNYTTGKIKRTATSTITSGQTVKVTYNYQDVTTFYSRIEHKNILIRDAIGQETLSTCRIYCDYDTVIDPKDKITSDDFDVTYPEILMVKTEYDENGEVDHKVIYTK